jgi:23S rRNA pseudouridine955/2504/2580 synthase
MISFPIVYENNEILLINKASGVAVQGGEGIAHPLDEELSKQVGYKIYLVHRLDKETAGLLVVAKTPAAASKWTNLFAGGQVHKEYTAICFGTPVVGGKRKTSGTISSSVSKNGRDLPAVTNFTVEESVSVPVPETDAHIDLSLLHLVLGTGRMHQIRIHLAQSSCPIAGDDKHGDFKANKIAKKVCGIHTLCLAAVKITLPADGKNTVFTVPLPPHMQKLYDEFFAPKPV